jgi:hypothetical protein
LRLVGFANYQAGCMFYRLHSVGQSDRTFASINRSKVPKCKWMKSNIWPEGIGWGMDSGDPLGASVGQAL